MEDQQHTVSMYDKHVREYVDRFMNLDLYRESFVPFVESLTYGASVVDLGCGPGNVIRHLRALRPDLSFLGMDLAPAMIREAEVQNPGVSFEVMDIRDAGQLGRCFEGIIAAFCLPYLPAADVPLLFHEMNRLAAPGALLYLSLMKGPRGRSGMERTSFTGTDELYINYYGRSEIETWLDAHDFHIESLRTIDYPEGDGSMTMELVYLARKRSCTDVQAV